MKKILLIGFICSALWVNLSHAQDNRSRFSLEFNGGGSLPLSRIDNVILKNGFGFEGLVHYSFIPGLGIYGGWGWNRLASYSASDICYEETGYIIGLNFRIAGNDPKIAFYLRAGGLFNHIESENPEGLIISDTGHGPGYQLAGGVDMALGNRWSFTPGIKFNSLKREVTDEGITSQVKYQYLSARIGFTRRF